MIRKPLRPAQNSDEEIDLVVERLGVNGEGVGRFEGFTLFVDGALPQETVRARVYERKKTFARAHVVETLTHSPHRVEPPCPLFGRCGGCQLMHLNYPQQLEAKRDRVIDALERIAKIDVEVLPCISSPQPLAYRNKIQLPVSVNNRLGLYARNTHDLVEIEQCAIHCPLGEKVFGHIQRILKTSPKTTDLKHVLIKTSVNTEQVLVILVTKSQEPPTFLADQIFKSTSEIKGVVQNINPSENNVILGREFRTLVGRGWIEEQLCGLHFKVSPASFFQVNTAQAQALYQKVLELACLTGKEKVLDAYCGVGTLSLIVARQVREVIGIESVAEAIIDAKENARLNQIRNAKFICGRAEEKISQLGKIDVAIINPPRKGCDRAFLEILGEKRPQRILYVSCDPATLARDLQFLTQKGYRLNTVQPFDMFPQTMHVECVAALHL
jgi:23S rRNA (uracil1939-C5)-methyltransferase